MWHQLIFRYPSGGGPSRPSTAYAIEYTAFTSMQRCIQQKTSKPFPDSQKSLGDCDRSPARNTQNPARPSKATAESPTLRRSTRDKVRNGGTKDRCRYLSSCEE